MNTGATVVFDKKVRVSDNPGFIDRCRRAADILNERVGGSISLRFFGLHFMGDLGRLRLRAEVAWRNEVFAMLSEVPRGHGENHADLHGTSPGPFERERTLHANELPGELGVILSAHLHRVLKENEERVRYARETLPLLQRVSLSK